MGEGRRMRRENGRNGQPLNLNGAAHLPLRPQGVGMKFVPMDVTIPSLMILNTPEGPRAMVIGGTSHIVAMAQSIAPSMGSSTPKEIAARAAEILNECAAYGPPGGDDDEQPEEPAPTEPSSAILTG